MTSTKNGNSTASAWLFGVFAAILSGCMVSLFVWTIRSIVDSMQRMESVTTRQLEGYRRVEGIEKKLDFLEERVRQIELGHR